MASTLTKQIESKSVTIISITFGGIQILIVNFRSNKHLYKRFINSHRSACAPHTHTRHIVLFYSLSLSLAHSLSIALSTSIYACACVWPTFGRFSFYEIGWWVVKTGNSIRYQFSSINWSLARFSDCKRDAVWPTGVRARARVFAWLCVCVSLTVAVALSLCVIWTLNHRPYYIL